MVKQLSLHGVSKSFGAAHALVNVDLTIAPGTIHALIGENGAGKSTALKILAGLEQPTTGSVVRDGRPVVLANRTAAIRTGIGLVAQQLSLNPELTLAENLILNQSERIASRTRATKALDRVATEAGLTLATDTPVRNLGFAQRQLGELAIALAQGAEILLLDEPTSALGPHETDTLFQRLKLLAANGVSILLITHRLADARSIADDVTALSRGRVTLASTMSAVTDDDLVTAMVGSAPDAIVPSPFAGGEQRLILDRVSISSPGQVSLDSISLTVRRGEIVGVLGVAGNGQSLLADAAVGMIPISSGSITVDGTDISGHPGRAHEADVAYVPEVRADFLLPDSPITHSAVLRRLGGSTGGPKPFRRFGLLDWKSVRAFAFDLCTRHDVRPLDVGIRAGALSGGNQQKLLVGRELDGHQSTDAPAVAVLHGPTQGLDLGAAAAIRGEVRDAAAKGTAILLVSADLDEVRELSHRILVMAKGRIVDQFDTADFDIGRFGRAAAGLNGGSRIDV